MTETIKQTNGQTLAFYITVSVVAVFIYTLGNEIDLLKLIALILFWTGFDRIFRKEIDAYNKDIFD